MKAERACRHNDETSERIRRCYNTGIPHYRDGARHMAMFKQEAAYSAEQWTGGRQEGTLFLEAM